MAWTEGHTVRVATAEGLILTKLVAFRPQDQADIETLLIANRDEIDRAVIREEWAAVAAGGGGPHRLAGGGDRPPRPDPPGVTQPATSPAVRSAG